MTFIIFRNFYFRIIIKKLNKLQYLKTFAVKNNEKYADHNLEKLCPCLERVCHRKVGPWPWIFVRVHSLEGCVLDSISVHQFEHGRYGTVR